MRIDLMSTALFFRISPWLTLRSLDRRQVLTSQPLDTTHQQQHRRADHDTQQSIQYGRQQRAPHTAQRPDADRFAQGGNVVVRHRYAVAANVTLPALRARFSVLG